MVNIDIEEIKRKNEVIDNAIVELKKKYIGVDEQIDEIMNNVRTWYCYPQLQDRPCVINLWGLSGCSKTDSVRTIAKLLDLEEDLIYFNFADINEKNAWEIERERLKIVLVMIRVTELSYMMNFNMLRLSTRRKKRKIIRER